MRASVVIGSNFGDEGKGITTDYIASTGKKSLVVRFNGGAQAGHTVELADGRRHVFSHFGSGTMTGAHTFLSKHFIVNPSFFLKEREALVKLGFYPDVLVDNRAFVTTPFDILINRALEEQRGTARHGSVGLGINETVTRSLAEDGQFKITPDDLRKGRNHLADRLYDIEENYIYDRLEALGLHIVLDPPDELITQWIDDASSFCDKVTFVEKVSELSHFMYDCIVFEGAQGLLLDEDHEYFPHVTRSKTGIHNAMQVAREMGFISGLDVHYVTRPYMTRHGAGPFPTYVEGMKLTDETNVPNDWQETMKFGKLDVAAWAREVEADLLPFADHKGVPWIATVIPVLTWFEHDGKYVDVLYHGEAWMSYLALARLLSHEVQSTATLVFRGKTRESAAVVLI